MEAFKEDLENLRGVVHLGLRSPTEQHRSAIHGAVGGCLDLRRAHDSAARLVLPLRSSDSPSGALTPWPCCFRLGARASQRTTAYLLEEWGVGEHCAESQPQRSGRDGSRRAWCSPSACAGSRLCTWHLPLHAKICTKRLGRAPRPWRGIGMGRRVGVLGCGCLDFLQSASLRGLLCPLQGAEDLAEGTHHARASLVLVLQAARQKQALAEGDKVPQRLHHSTQHTAHRVAITLCQGAVPIPALLPQNKGRSVECCGIHLSRVVPGGGYRLGPAGPTCRMTLRKQLYCPVSFLSPMPMPSLSPPPTSTKLLEVSGGVSGGVSSGRWREPGCGPHSSRSPALPSCVPTAPVPPSSCSRQARGPWGSWGPAAAQNPELASSSCPAPCRPAPSLPLRAASSAHPVPRRDAMCTHRRTSHPLALCH